MSDHADDVDGGDAAEGVTRDVTPPPENSASHRPLPAALGERGRRLWTEMAGLRLGPAHVLLLERTCRIADRCEQLDTQLGAAEGDNWLTLVKELRQTEIALKLCVAELRHAGRPVAAAGGQAVVEPPQDTQDKGATGGNVRSIAAIRNAAARR